MSKGDSDPQPATRADDTATRLAGYQLDDMATGQAADPQVEAAWRAVPDPAVYAGLVEDEARPLAVRFAAALVLRSHGAQAEAAATAAVYAGALRDDLVGAAWPWGTLWGDGDGLGLLGGAVVELGRPAVPALVALLDDAAPRDSYLGSEEATEMSMRQYRVKDFAAFYLAKIVGAELPYERELAKRDAAIAALKGKL